MQYASGILLPPVQKLVATSIFALGEDANESLTLRFKNPHGEFLKCLRTPKISFNFTLVEHQILRLKPLNYQRMYAKIKLKAVFTVVKHGASKTEAKYRQFDIVSKIVLYLILTIAIILIVFFALTKSNTRKILYGCLLILNTVLIIFVSTKIANKRSAYLHLLLDERNSIVRNGLFKDIYDAYTHDGFEFNLTYDRLLFEEYHNNSIDIGIRKNDHEFLILMDDNSISILVDKETDQPVKTEFPLAGISTLDQLYLTINSFIQEHS